MTDPLRFQDQEDMYLPVAKRARPKARLPWYVWAILGVVCWGAIIAVGADLMIGEWRKAQAKLREQAEAAPPVAVAPVVAEPVAAKPVPEQGKTYRLKAHLIGRIVPASMFRGWLETYLGLMNAREYKAADAFESDGRIKWLATGDRVKVVDAYVLSTLQQVIILDGEYAGETLWVHVNNLDLK